MVEGEEELQAFFPGGEFTPRVRRCDYSRGVEMQVRDPPAPVSPSRVLSMRALEYRSTERTTIDGGGHHE